MEFLGSSDPVFLMAKKTKVGTGINNSTRMKSSSVFWSNPEILPDFRVTTVSQILITLHEILFTYNRVGKGAVCPPPLLQPQCTAPLQPSPRVTQEYSSVMASTILFHFHIGARGRKGTLLPTRLNEENTAFQHQTISLTDTRI